jgi:AmiR/NasT family two-component response regulator
MSGSEESRLAETSIAQDALAYLVKPFDVDQLLDALELCFVP